MYDTNIVYKSMNIYVSVRVCQGVFLQIFVATMTTTYICMCTDDCMNFSLCHQYETFCLQNVQSKVKDYLSSIKHRHDS